MANRGPADPSGTVAADRSGAHQEPVRDRAKTPQRAGHRSRSSCADRDAGREGELIFRYVYEAARCKKPVKRLWLSSLTPDAIDRAFRNLKDAAAYDTLAQAARARGRADWLIGMNFSRAYSVAHDEMCAGGAGADPDPGALVVARELEVQAFVPGGLFGDRGPLPARPRLRRGLGARCWSLPLSGAMPAGRVPRSGAISRPRTTAPSPRRRGGHRDRRAGRRVVPPRSTSVERESIPPRAMPLRPHRAPTARQPPLRDERAATLDVAQAAGRTEDSFSAIRGPTAVTS